MKGRQQLNQRMDGGGAMIQKLKQNPQMAKALVQKAMAQMSPQQRQVFMAKASQLKKGMR